MATAAVQNPTAVHQFLAIERGHFASAAGKPSIASTSVYVATFDCGICFDSFPEGAVSRVGPCGHSFCRPCLLQYLQSKLTERRPPIVCPTCTAQCTSSGPTVISKDMVSQLRVSLSAKELATWAELEMMCHSVLLSCGQCNTPFFVKKEKYEAQETIPCPLVPGCKHSWCKACSRWFDLAGPKHTCDGSSELDYLITQQGWKRCPGCHTPTSKIDGCNEITCISPGCNVHFCYHCGEVIFRSVSANDPRRVRAKQEHFAKCRAY